MCLQQPAALVCCHGPHGPSSWSWSVLVRPGPSWSWGSRLSWPTNPPALHSTSFACLVPSPALFCLFSLFCLFCCFCLFSLSLALLVSGLACLVVRLLLLSLLVPSRRTTSLLTLQAFSLPLICNLLRFVQTTATSFFSLSRFVWSSCRLCPSSPASSTFSVPRDPVDSFMPLDQDPSASIFHDTIVHSPPAEAHVDPHPLSTTFHFPTKLEDARSAYGSPREATSVLDIPSCC